MTRKLTTAARVLVAIAIIAATALAPQVHAAAHGGSDPADAHLDGDFRIHGKVIRDDFRPPGHRFDATLSFDAACPQGACYRVYFRRDVGFGSHLPTILRRKEPGLYRGYKRRRRVFCPHKGLGTESFVLSLRITGARDGAAVRIQGTDSYEFRCRDRSGIRRQEVRFRGRIKRPGI